MSQLPSEKPVAWVGSPCKCDIGQKRALPSTCVTIWGSTGWKRFWHYFQLIIIFLQPQSSPFCFTVRPKHLTDNSQTSCSIMQEDTEQSCPLSFLVRANWYSQAEPNRFFQIRPTLTDAGGRRKLEHLVIERTERTPGAPGSWGIFWWDMEDRLGRLLIVSAGFERIIYYWALWQYTVCLAEQLL